MLYLIFCHKIDHDNILKPAGDLLITGNAISCYRKNGNKKWINLFCENLIHFTASKSVVPAPEAFSDKFFRKMQYAAVHKTYNTSDRLADTMDPLQ